MANQRFATCPNEFCNNVDSGSIVSKCEHCGKPYCIKVTPYGNKGCAADGKCPHCGQAVQLATLLGYIYD